MREMEKYMKTLSSFILYGRHKPMLVIFSLRYTRITCNSMLLYKFAYIH